MKIIRNALLTIMMTAFAAPAIAVEEGRLLVWIYADKAYNGVDEVGQWFTEEVGIPVMVEHPVDTANKFQHAAAAGKGPDIIIWAHDRAGEWSESGLLVSIDPSDDVRNAIDQKAWDAFTIDGKIWGYPMSLESIGLIYNKKFVKSPPKTMEEVFEIQQSLAEQDVDALLWDYKNTYFSWPFLAAQGGYIFAEDDGVYDVTDVGVNNNGAVQGAEFIRKLITEDVMPLGVGYPEMDAAFNQEKVAMVINGPWSWKNMKSSKLDFAVAPLPTLGGKPLPAFVGVQGLMISRNSPNKDIAKIFIEEFALSMDGLRLINNDKPIGVPAVKDFYKELENDPLIKQTLANVEQGKLMPNTPQMGLFWAALDPAMENIVLGRQAPKAALDNAASRITDLADDEEE